MAADFSANQASPSVQLMMRVLDESAALLASDRVAALGLPDDDMHREILLPLLPAMLADKAIRTHWVEKTATGFVSRVKAAMEPPGQCPLWQASDFEIHVAASYLAGPDARALADTLLSEESLREMTAAIMNAALQAVWLAPAAVEPDIVPQPAPPEPEVAEPEPEPEPEPAAPHLAAFVAREVLHAKGVRNRTLRRVLRLAGIGTFIVRRGIGTELTAWRAIATKAE